MTGLNEITMDAIHDTLKPHTYFFVLLLLKKLFFTINIISYKRNVIGLTNISTVIIRV